MKIIFLILISLFILISCDKGSVEPDIVVVSNADAFKEAERLKKKFAQRSKRQRDFTKNSIAKQGKRRQFLDDTSELQKTDEEKINYYLSIAIQADKVVNFLDARKYSKKVLELEPRNAEAKRIYKKYSRMAAVPNADTVIKRAEKKSKKLLKIFTNKNFKKLSLEERKRRTNYLFRNEKYTYGMRNGKPRIVRKVGR